MGDKELVDVWRKEFESLHNNLASYKESEKDAMWRGFLMAKRSQPSVVLPKVEKTDNTDVAFYAVKVFDSLTAAGIKYTVGE